MSDTDDEDVKGKIVNMPVRVGYKSPPVYTRFRPGPSRNPGGRAKGVRNFNTLFNKTLNEQIAVREDANTGGRVLRLRRRCDGNGPGGGPNV
jgi:hypothetical protein